MTFQTRSAVLRLCAAAASVFALTFASVATAQRNSRPPCNAPSTILVAWPQAPDKKAQLELRDKTISAIKDALGKDVCVVDPEQMNGWLKSSMYPVDSALPTRDWLQLANVVRGDEVLELAAVPSGKGYRVTGRLTMVRDESVRDSLPSAVTGDNIGQAAKLAVAELRKMRAMLPQETVCYRKGREKQYAEAEAAGRQALAAYPGNMARLCIATALREAGKNTDEVIALADQVRRSDPTNALALLHLLNSYYDKGDQSNYAQIGTTMISNDPSSPFAETIIANLASWKRTDAALALVKQSLQNDPDSPKLRNIEFRLEYASDNLKESLKLGEGLAKLDTAAVDTSFVVKMASGYVRDSQPEKAAEWLARGTQKFPESVQLAQALATQLRQMGQRERAIDEYKRIIKMNPDGSRGMRLYVATVYNEMGNTDSAAAWARRAADAGDDKAQASGVVLQIGNSLLKSAQETKSPDDFKKVIPYMAFADSVASNDLAKFVWGYSALQIATAGLLQMQTPAGQTCPIAKETRDWLGVAAEKVLAGARADPRNAPTLLQTIPSYIDGVDKVLAQLRCTSTTSTSTDARR